MDSSYINSLVQRVLNKEFSNRNKRKINQYNDRANFACPYCGDSSRNDRAKRGNLYYNRLFYVCFNCDKKTTLDKLCKDYDEQIDPDKKLEMIEYLDSVMTYSDYENEFLDAQFDDLIDLEDLKTAIERKVTPITDFEPIDPKKGIFKYLISRGIPPNMHRDIYQGKYWRNEDESEWIIIMLNRKQDKVLGMQVRNLKSGRRRMFKIYNYENILEWVNVSKGIEDTDMDISKLTIYNKLSYYFNILNVDFNKTVTVFEGYLDSLFYPNSIGLVGVNTDFRFLESNGFDIQYFFDNDDAGFQKSESKLKDGFKVFLWYKLFENVLDSKKNVNHFQLWNKITKVKDINKLAEIVFDPYKKLKLYDFFSNDVLDIKWIPKKDRNKKKFDEDWKYKNKLDNFKHL
jgi:hypothetical protein